MTQPGQELSLDPVPDREVDAAPPPAAEPKSQRLTPKRLILIFVAVLAGTVGGTLIAKSLGNGDGSDGMAQWMSSYGTNYQAVSRDAGSVNAASTATTLRADCERLTADVRIAMSNPPMPDASLEAPWSSILTNLKSGATACVASLDQQSKTQMDHAVQDFNTAGSKYLQLIRAVDAAG